MIEQIHIENFKSIYNLEIELGRVNLFIGENGSGKSNLLEALVFVSAYQSNKLDNEFLASRGLRVTNPELMKSAFEKDYKNESIKISIGKEKDLDSYEFNNENNENLEYAKWVSNTEQEVADFTNKLFGDIPDNTRNKFVQQIMKENNITSETEVYNTLLSGFNKVFESEKINFKDFLIYSPENTALRKFEEEGQIQPLGINGEGLLKLLKFVNNYEDKSYINTIIESLQLFDWFEDIKIPDNLSYGEDKVIITDKYLYQTIDQRSTNEGFLFILFYITLLVAKETPKAFAIDNIDASLNPKLCTKLILIINDLAKKYNKQVFLTTHNPAILDGMNLNEEEQKLFVVSRNKSGHTRMKNITAENKPKSSNDEAIKLSEAFLRGYLGGLPKGF